MAVAHTKQAHQHRQHKAPTAAPAASAFRFATEDGGKPWDFSFTKTTLTLSWIALGVIVFAVCMLGGFLGYMYRKHRSGDQGPSHYLEVNADAHDLYV